MEVKVQCVESYDNPVVLVLVPFESLYLFKELWFSSPRPTTPGCKAKELGCHCLFYTLSKIG